MGVACCKEEAIDFTQEVELGHFHLLRSVGKGAFGKVRIVQHRGSQGIFALKYINKEKCIKMRAVENIIQERRLLEEIDCSFVCNLRYAFQDDENLFMVIDLMLGGDLRFHLDRMGIMKESMVKFYAAEVACGLAYLHSKNIVHRDLKPDNVLLDEKGHAHLTDFNIAVRFREEKMLSAVAGSMAYMAPEILVKKGYLATVDWWSLGVLLYEMAFGRVSFCDLQLIWQHLHHFNSFSKIYFCQQRPFRAKTNEALTQAIISDELEFASNAADFVSPAGLDAIKQMIQRDITKRLGCKGTGGFEGFKAHPWFKDYDWAVIEKKEGTPPFVPDSKRANFDATHELEELLLEDNPLKVKPRKKRKEGEEREYVPKEGEDPTVTRDMRIMEEKFTVYDFTKARPNAAKNAGQQITMKAISNIPGSIPGAPTAEPSMMKDVMEGREHEVCMTGLDGENSSKAGAATLAAGEPGASAGAHPEMQSQSQSRTAGIGMSRP
ncbi:kinase-like domain-containing protein [Fimicolochytrium jonesii]|uniref:kinase-like domain-containing protein n=1 Tax=Fimicolochytrium jonesii TaxID=1396493 RepID=UPI0022FE1282|nr:kinase-like domain-containing protein [Fimicolochytrium jonesii]KAI8819651.1 kinase-like domain-containing protein [Fimicolochytrium jonesii]